MKIKEFLKKTLAIVLVLTMLAPIMGNLEANIKEVHAEEISLSEILSVKCQVTDGVVTETSIDKYRGNYVMRFVSSIESLNYKEVGFKISYEENGEIVTKTNKTKTVFSRIDSTTGSTESGADTYSFSPKVISTESEYFITAKLPVAPEDINVDYTVWAFARTSAGQTIEGPKRCVSVNDGLKDCQTINMSFENTGNVTVNTGDVLTVNNDYTAKVIGVDSETVHVRISGVNKDTMKSATKFTFVKDNDTIGSEIFRNLYSKYDGTRNTKDTSWYDEYSTKTKFTIASIADLYGLAELVDGGTTLSGKTIYMVSDIAANPEKMVTDSKDSNYLKWEKSDGTFSSAPSYTWEPIGKRGSSDAEDVRFAGIFDGQGHTISGIYLVASAAGAGLFATTAIGSTLQDFRLEDSYVASSYMRVGSIVGSFAGTLDTVYSNAIVKTNKTDQNGYGGMAGYVYETAKFTNCWYAGTLTASNYAAGIAGRIQSGTGKVTFQHCLFDGEIRVNANNGNIGGIGGFVQSAESVTIEDTLSCGEINYNSGIVTVTCGSVIAATNNVTVEVKNSYGNATHNIAGSATKVTTTNAENMTPANCLGANGLDLEYLDFENHWVAKQNSTPKLMSMVDSFANAKEVTTNEEGKKVYTLDTAEELYEFAMYSQKWTFADKIVQLGADIVANAGTATEAGWTENENPTIWVPIGSESTPFAGTFDGQGKSISGIYANSTTSQTGLFSVATDATIKDFCLENSYIESNNGRTGSIAGRFRGSLDKIYSNAIIKNTSTSLSRYGGLVGYVDGAATITNCWFAGSISGNSVVGGLAGYVDDGDNTHDVVFEHCLNSGTVKVTGKSGSGGGLIGAVSKVNTITIFDTLNVKEVTLADGVTSTYLGSVAGTSSKTINFTNSYFAGPQAGCGSGTLNNVGSGKITVENNLGNNAYNMSNLDFANYWVAKHNSTPELKVLSDTFLNEVAYDKNENPVYTVDSKEDLYEFAIRSQFEDFANSTVRLGADIVANAGTATENGWTENDSPTAWLPIGSNDKPFAGTFDGQGHTISGIYANSTTTQTGLFSVATDATIKDFRLENSYIESNNGRTGSIAGRFSGNLDTVYSNAIIKNTSTSLSRYGGLVGYVDGAATISNCWFAGSISGNSNVGGIVGYVDDGDNTKDVVIEHCLNSGTIQVTGGSGSGGGLVGAISKAKTITILDTLNVKSVTIVAGKTSSYLGSVAGTSNKTINFTNSYFAGPQSGCPSFASGASLNAVNSGKITVENNLGNNGYKMKNLDFANYWVAKHNSTPELKSFSDTFLNDVAYDKNENPIYTIDSKEDLYEFAIRSQFEDFANSTVQLGADIVANEGTATETGWTANDSPTVWLPIGSETKPFAGTFDGKGKTISGIYLLEANKTNYVGMFAKTTPSAIIQNLRLENSYFESNGQGVGSIAGYGEAHFYNVYSNAIVKSSFQWVGGLIGHSGYTEMERCWFDGVVISTANNNQYMGKGGLIGIQNGGTATIVNCLNTGKVDVSAYNAVTADSTNVSPRAGGLVGYVTNGASITIDSSLNTGSIKLHADVNHGYGRLVGYKSSNCAVMISNSYATTNTWTDDDAIMSTVSYEIVAEEEIKGTAAKDVMPLLDWTNVWACGEEGKFPQIIFSEENLGQNADYTATSADKTFLNNAYQGLTLAYGDMHAHAKETHSYPAAFDTTYEANALNTWKTEMSEHGLDFVASLDHHQTDHIESTAWNTSMFLYGTEAGTYISGLKNGRTGETHYNMLFAGTTQQEAKDKLDSVLVAFTDKFNSNSFKLEESKYEYGNFTKAEFTSLINKVQEKGGFFVIPHPNYENALLSSDWQDYDFGVDKVGFEVIERSLSEPATQVNYKYWKELLASGRKYFACAGSDIHGSLNGEEGNPQRAEKAITSVYVSEKNSVAYLEQFKDGNFTAGSVGIKMCIGKDGEQTAMGDECDFAGKRLVVEIGQFHQYVNNPNRKYHVDIITDKGVIYSQPLTLTENGPKNAVIALDTKEEYKFYRVEVVDENDARRIAYGNPIWNTNVVTK